MTTPNKRIFAIEGNIGAGKSTLLSLLKEYIPNCCIIPEPVYEWKHVGNMDLLASFYGGPKRWCFTFEIYSMYTMYTKLKEALNNNTEIIFMERTLYSNRAFHRVSEDLGNINCMEMFLLSEIYNFYKKEIPSLDGIIYIDTPTNICLKRINSRGRVEENNITETYLTKLEKQFLNIKYDCEKIKINGNYNLNDPLKVIKTIVDFIENK